MGREDWGRTVRESVLEPEVTLPPPVDAQRDEGMMAEKAPEQPLPQGCRGPPPAPPSEDHRQNALFCVCVCGALLRLFFVY